MTGVTPLLRRRHSIITARSSYHSSGWDSNKGRRQPTRSEHLRELIDLYGFRFYTLEEGQELSHWLLTLAPRWESPVRLVTALIEEMRRRQVVLPALSLIELIVRQRQFK